MLNDLLKYLIVLVVFFCIDMVWLGVVAKKFYRQKLGYLMGEKTKWAAAIIFYLIYIFGLLYFVVNPALQGQGSLYALYTGALFGLIAYSTYDLTNLAVVKDWPLNITIIDMIWGSVLSAGTCFVSVLVISLLKLA